VPASFTCPVNPSVVGATPPAVPPNASYRVRDTAPVQFAPDSVPPLGQLNPAVAAVVLEPALVQLEPDSVAPDGQP
jgi:hypothetical protein